MLMDRRYIKVDLSAKSGIKTLTGMDIEFNIDKYMSSQQNSCRVRIKNLNREDVDYLTTFTSQNQGQNGKKQLTVYAGYGKGDATQLFSGDIVDGYCSGDADYDLFLRAVSNFYDSKILISLSFADITFKFLCEEVAKKLNLGLNYQSTIAKNIGAFSFVGSAGELIDKLNENSEVIVFEDDGILVIIDKDVSADENVKTISKYTSMIGVPYQNSHGISVTTLLDTEIKLGKFVEVQSERVREANGKYRVWKIQYEGSSHGNKFYSKFECGGAV